MNKIERIDSLLNSCNDFLNALNENAVWNLNVGINAADYIDAASSEWRIFVNQINSLDKLVGSYSSIDALKQIVASVTRIDGTAIDDLIVKLNELKTEIETAHISSGDLVDNKSQLLHLSSKEPKIFISHSTKDENYVNEIVGLLEDIGVSEEGIFCSSVAGYGIPGGQNIYDYLRGQFETFNLHVLFVLSENYYNSCACLNEMGAAWVKRNKHTTILLPGFSFDEIKGVLDKEAIVTKLDDREDTLNIRLSELRDEVITEFNLSEISEHKWERIRNNFIKSVRSI